MHDTRLDLFWPKSFLQAWKFRIQRQYLDLPCLSNVSSLAKTNWSPAPRYVLIQFLYPPKINPQTYTSKHKRQNLSLPDLTLCLMPQWTEQMQCLPPPSGCRGYRKEPPALRGKAQSHNIPGHIMDIQQTPGVHPLLSWWRTLSPKPQALPDTFQWHPQFLAGMRLYQSYVIVKWALNSATIAPVLFSRCYWNPGPWDQMIYNH